MGGISSFFSLSLFSGSTIAAMLALATRNADKPRANTKTTPRVHRLIAILFFFAFVMHSHLYRRKKKKGLVFLFPAHCTFFFFFDSHSHFSHPLSFFLFALLLNSTYYSNSSTIPHHDHPPPASAHIKHEHGRCDDKQATVTVGTLSCSVALSLRLCLPCLDSVHPVPSPTTTNTGTTSKRTT